jgi:hypothetical protein
MAINFIKGKPNKITSDWGEQKTTATLEKTHSFVMLLPMYANASAH